jgi:protein-disulfide isomerase
MSEGFECEFCGEEFSTERGMKIHQGQKHDDVEEEEESTEESQEPEENESQAFIQPENITIPATHVAVFTLVLGIALGFSGGTFVGLNMVGDSLTFNQTADAGTGDSGGDGGEDQLREVSMDNINLSDSPSLGDENAPIKIVEYSDFGCPFCAEFAGFDASPRIPIDRRNTFEKLKNQYIDTGQVEFIYKDYPVDSLHPNAIEAHKAANCVYDIEGNAAYWKYHDELYDRRSSWTSSGAGDTDGTFRQISDDLGLETSNIMECYRNSDGSEIEETRQQATLEFGRLGTPTFFIGKEGGNFTEISGAQSLPVFEQIISRVEES